MYNFIFYHYLKNECFNTEVLQVQEHMTALVLKRNVLLHWNWLKTANIAIKSLKMHFQVEPFAYIAIFNA